MTALSNNDIAEAIYLVSKDKSHVDQVNLSEKVRAFLFRKRLLSKAPEILSRLSKIINQEEGRIVAKVSSPEKLDPKTKTNLEQALKKRYLAKEVALSETIDVSLLGGIKVQVNDELIDLSIKNKIGKLQEHLTKSV